MSEKKAQPERDDEKSKDADLERNRVDTEQKGYLTTEQGVRVEDTDNSLKVGDRGPTLLEDFHLREKITHFDHERIPERVVHARGSGAHGYFQVYESLADLTRAKFLQDPSVKTPVFVRFSTVVGSRGSSDTPRDVRGFATKFYTEEGNYDLVGNNIPVFFIQDGIKFPDIIHSVKPEPDREIPQAASAHDTFWDFASLVPEITHMLMWVLSDRAIPRSYRMMEGFGVHTFRLVNAKGEAHFVKFHWKPLLGVHSLVWDEAQKIYGKDPDFNRRDLWDAIASGNYPEYELGLQIIEEKDEHAFAFDLLDPTKIVPEELVPVRRVGKMVLNRNPDNFFAETEQVAFCTQNVVSGIDFTDDPLLQVRNFSYLDTQLLRLGGPNFTELPINRAVAQVQNNNRDGLMQHRIFKGRVAYTPNSLAGGCPMAAPEKLGGFVHYAEKVSGKTIRMRSPSFADHYTQAKLFWDSIAPWEKEHLIAAARFELGKVETEAVRARMVEGFAKVDIDFARAVAEGIGVPPPAAPPPAVPAQATPAPGKRSVARSPAVSMANTVKNSIKTRKIAILVADGVSGAELQSVRAALLADGAVPELVGPRVGSVKTAEGGLEKTPVSFQTTASVLYDAVYVPGGKASADTLKALGLALHFINEAYKHHKPIGASGEGVEVLKATSITGVKIADATAQGKPVSDKGVVTVESGKGIKPFILDLVQAIAVVRHWDRDTSRIPA
ncbi:Catalase [Minicystis rosea]|nr:Catalase [Minicystis rosea]